MVAVLAISISRPHQVQHSHVADISQIFTKISPSLHGLANVELHFIRIKKCILHIFIM